MSLPSSMSSLMIFETIKAKSTSFDQPDPEWKYLSGFAVSKEKKKQRQVTHSTDHPQGSLTDSSTPPLPQDQPLDLLQSLEVMNKGQDRDQPFADDTGATEVIPVTPQAQPLQTKSGRVIRESAPYQRIFSWGLGKPFWIRMNNTSSLQLSLSMNFRRKWIILWLLQQLPILTSYMPMKL